MDTIAASPHKILHLVRHAEGVHNLESDKSRDPLTSFEFLDAQLSSLGRQQVVAERKHVRETGLLDEVEVVIVSPMTRTLETAVGIFGGKEQADALDVSSCQDSNVNSNETSAIFNSRPRIVAYELCRERMIENEDDVLWKSDERESYDEIQARTIKFLKWLWERKEQKIAVVSHGIFLQKAMIELVKNNNFYRLPLRGHPIKLERKNWYPLMDDEYTRSRFKNCEIRSIAILHESMMESDAMISKQQYCGRIGKEMLQIRDSSNDKMAVEELEVTI
ncbi:phosphoglycerate mutase-like protein 1 isoform X3 [Gossypium raimondii]|uniref:phosphoglycerate mutase-like protein 1 isoform X3 n=1 Tax=Gossypium raimondii TaxID=29730 RepID=UPI00227A5C2B|nr:phosphoglycerate mutase-like protein 1 isoform X3 [Gossypium raimondii]